MRSRQKASPKAIALWRYEQIEEALGVRSREIRGQVLRQRARMPVLWPSGDSRPVSLATLYRWLELHERGGFAALRPVPRKDKGTRRGRLPSSVVEKAIALLASDPDASLTFVITLLRTDPEVSALLGDRVEIAASTLHRRLREHPGFARLERARKRERRRRRYVARAPHDIWHLDAKGPVSVRLTSGIRVAFHVLTVLDDATRAVLASVVANSPDLSAAVRVFRRAANRWGLPALVYADRASIFDSVPFRQGLAELGSHRIKVRPRNPEANGKIEAFHRVLVGWFTGRLGRQRVVDLVHLQQLLEGMVEVLYQDHKHRSLKCSPRRALGDRTSSRKVAAARLDEAFRQELKRKAHPKTGEVDLADGTYLVPDNLRGQRLTFSIDPERALPPTVCDPVTGHQLPLERAQIRPEDRQGETEVERWGEGPLQALYDTWQGKVRPVAEPGFGLPELFILLAEAAGRPVPRSDAEAAQIQRRYRSIGPLAKKATETALRRIGKEIGAGRPISAYLDALERRVIAPASLVRKTKRRQKS